MFPQTHTVALKMKPQCKMANVSATVDLIFIKFKAHKRIVDQQKIWVILCAHTRAQKAKMCACPSKRAHTDLCLVRTFFVRIFTKIVLIVHYCVMTLSIKFHKDPSFGCGDIYKIMLNMYARKS